ncbi:MAG TPA: aspartyl protease family protein [Steroidobacteraceae bacterium]|nr:aspartyl protease family protein [Steroidobacteraceae bacterium]
MWAAAGQPAPPGGAIVPGRKIEGIVRALRIRLWLVLAALAAPGAQAGECHIVRLPDIAVTMKGLVPIVHAQLNGADAEFIADSGAFFSLVTPAAVQRYQLRMDASFQGLAIEGIGGLERAQLAEARTFSLLGVPWHNVQFVVAGSGFTDSGAVGLLGQNVFRVADVEYDLANGVIRLVELKGDCKHMPLAYWASAADKPYSVIDIEFATAASPHTRAAAMLNGTRIEVMFDSGAALSMLTLRAAERAGMSPRSAGVTPGGTWRGLGHGVATTWIGRFASFKLGDEEIRNAPLRFGADSLVGADMLIGADFFLSHRIYVANGQHKLYFTYNGGPAFNLETTRQESADAGVSPRAPVPAATPGAAPAAQASDMTARLDEPTDAAAFARRGTASAARREYAPAIADLTRAIELDPAQAEFFYQRGRAYDLDGQTDKALEDISQAIKLKPDDVGALMARAELHARRNDPPGTINPDLDAADRAASKAGEMRLSLGNLYQRVRNYPAAIAQYDDWIDSHRGDDVGMPHARDARCRARALEGKDLERALEDCNFAVRRGQKTAGFFDSRGLVYLRLGKYDKAIADYDSALALSPQIAWSLYGRGLAERHLGQPAAQADIAAAKALYPKIAEETASHGIVP